MSEFEHDSYSYSIINNVNKINKIEISHALIYNITLEYFIKSTWFKNEQYQLITLPFSNKEDALFVKNIISKYYKKNEGVIKYEENIVIIYNNFFNLNGHQYTTMANIDIVNNIFKKNSNPEDFIILSERKWIGKICASKINY